jgi:hypothetical protein
VRLASEPSQICHILDDNLALLANEGENRDDLLCSELDEDLAIALAERPVLQSESGSVNWSNLMSTDKPAAGTTTMNLDAQEKSELRQLVETALTDLRVEIHRTHTPDYRSQLLQREELLKRLIDKFKQTAS